MTDALQFDAARDSFKCPACAQHKLSGQIVCAKCFDRLSLNDRTKLYRAVTNDELWRFDAALDYLRAKGKGASA